MLSEHFDIASHVDLYNDDFEGSVALKRFKSLMSSSTQDL